MQEQNRGPTRRALVTASLIGLAAPAANAQGDWAPTRNVRMIVPYAPGGGADTVARLLARPMREALGQTVVVDNRAGAGGTIGAGEATRAPADGHTVLLDAAAHTANPSLYANLPFDYGTAFAPVSQVTVQPMLLLVRRDRSMGTFAEFVAEARAQRRGLSYGSAGNGTATHLAGANLQRLVGFEATHISYRGGGPMMQDLLAGNIDFVFAVAAISLQMVREDAIRPLAVSSARRLSSLPDVPTVMQLGFADFDIAEWNGLYLPAGATPAMVQAYSAAITHALRDATLHERLAALGAEPVGSDPESFARFLREDRERLARLIREAGITA